MKLTPSTNRRPTTVALLAIAAIMITQPLYAANGELCEYILTFDMPGMTMPIGSGEICRAQDGAQKPNLPNNCKRDQYSVGGNTSTFHAVCGPPQPSIMSGEVTRSGDQVNGIFKVKGDSGKIMIMHALRSTSKYRQKCLQAMTALQEKMSDLSSVKLAISCNFERLLGTRFKNTRLCKRDSDEGKIRRSNRNFTAAT